jgi:hypothetical protein
MGARGDLATVPAFPVARQASWIASALAVANSCEFNLDIC